MNTYNIGYSVIDANSCISVKTLAANITTCTPITVNPSTLNPGTVGMHYSRTLSATGGVAPYTFGTNASALPPGLSLSTSGTLSGTPTTTGDFEFIVRSNDAIGCFGERSYTLRVNSPCPIITVSPNTLPVGQVGLAYSVAFSAIGGTGPYVYTINGGPLPAGMSLNSNGNLTGTPTITGNFPFLVTATDVNGCTGERSYILVINSQTCPAISIDPPFLPVPQVGSAYNRTLTAIGGTAPHTFSVASGTLVTGLSLNSNGNLTGTPVSTGSFTFTVRVTDANGCTGERAFTQNVLPCEGITISPTGTGVPSGRVGIAYVLQFTASGGTGPYVFNLGNTSFLPLA